MNNVIKFKLNANNDTTSNSKFVALASFESEPTIANKVMAFNIEVTKQELDNLFSTEKYERPYQPEYYNPIEELIGELWTDATEEVALKLITDKINMFIPRLVISSNTSFSYSNYLLTMSLVFYDQYDANKQLYNYDKTFDMVAQ